MLPEAVADLMELLSCCQSLLAQHLAICCCTLLLAADEEGSAAVSTQKRKFVQSGDLPGLSGEVCTSDSEEHGSLAFAKSLFLKNKGKQGKYTSTPKTTPKNTPKSRKELKRRPKKQMSLQCCHLWKEHERDKALMEKPRGKAEGNNKSFQWKHFKGQWERIKYDLYLFYKNILFVSVR